MRRPVGAAHLIENLEGRLLLSTYSFISIPFGAGVSRNPDSALVADAQGNLYGTSGGGAYGAGTIFEIPHGTSSIQTLASFPNVTDNPHSGLAIDGDGNLYGTTQRGGSFGRGTVFKLSRGSGTIVTLAEFNTPQEFYPMTGVTVGSNLDLYGTTRTEGNPYRGGTVFEIPHDTGTLQTLVSFYDRNIPPPGGGVVLDPDGNIIGATYGYMNDWGSIFEIDHETGSLQTLASFGPPGAYPTQVTMDAAGNLYGIADPNTADTNIVFELPRGSHTLQTIASFKGTNTHINSLTVDAGGNLYGTTRYNGNGAYQYGTVFEIKHGTNNFLTLLTFNGTNGSIPNGLLVDGSGNLWGTTAGGGPNDDGTVFELSPQNSTPFLGHPFNITDTIEAENFDDGGEGLGYHDTTPQNLGGQYRSTAVDINAGGSNGFDVGYTAPGEWLDYPVTSPVAGTFVFQSAVASSMSGGSFHVEIDGQNVTGAMTVPDTGGWFNFQTVVSPRFTVSPGNHTVRVVMDSAGGLGAVGNFDYFRFNELPVPFHGTPFNIATDTIEAEDFDNGSDGVAYHDNTLPNVPDKYRNSAVDVAAVSNASNGFAVGFTAPGEWLSYSINAPTQGSYVLQARVANYKPGGTFHVEIDGQNVTGTMVVPDTGPWDTWQMLTSSTFSVTSGTHQMRVVMDQPGYWGNIGDFDSFRFVEMGGPFHGTPINIATDTVQAEDFDNGSDGLAYHDTTPQNIFGKYRSTGVDVFANSGTSNGFGVGYTAPGEWLSYTINAPAQGIYVLQARVANYKPGGAFHVEIDGQNVSGTMVVPDTGPWDTWQTITSQKFSIPPGNHVMRVFMESGGYWGNIGDFDWFKFTPASLITFGDRDMVSEGYPAGADPTAGATLQGLAPNVVTQALGTYSHGRYPSPDASDYPGTDQIYVGSSQIGGQDGYSYSSDRLNGPQTLHLDISSIAPAGQTIGSLTLGIAADDFEFARWRNPFTASINGVNNPTLTSTLNALVETGPKVHFFTIGLDPAVLGSSRILTIQIDEGGLGADGWAIDFLTVAVTPATPLPGGV